jgi:hypothetical protein
MITSSCRTQPRQNEQLDHVERSKSAVLDKKITRENSLILGYPRKVQFFGFDPVISVYEIVDFKLHMQPTSSNLRFRSAFLLCSKSSLTPFSSSTNIV